MKTETLLNAYAKCLLYLGGNLADYQLVQRMERQRKAFRAAILARDADLRDAVEAQKWVIDSQKRRIAEMEARIKDLEGTIDEIKEIYGGNTE